LVTIRAGLDIFEQFAMKTTSRIPIERAIQNFVEASVLPDLFPNALNNLAKSMNARGALLATPKFSRRCNPVSAGIDDSFSAYMEQGWYKVDERTQRGVEWYRANGAGFFCEDMLFSREELGKSNYFQGFAEKQDVPWFAASPLVGDEQDYVAITFNRRAKEGHFTREDIARLIKVLPSLRVAGLVCQASIAAREHGMLLALSMIAKPAFLLDWQGKVLDQNECGADFLGSALRLRFGRLTALTQSLQSRIDLAIDISLSATDGDAFPPKIVHLGSEAFPTTAKLQVMPIIGEAHNVFHRAKAIAIISLGLSHSKTSASALEASYGLSRRESEITMLLAKGKSIGQAALILGIGVGTARFYLKSIFSKTATHRQAELVSLILGLHS
jgi:DNA-binding CsgD family transcriptional regulator